MCLQPGTHDAGQNRRLFSSLRAQRFRRAAQTVRALALMMTRAVG